MPHFPYQLSIKKSNACLYAVIATTDKQYVIIEANEVCKITKNVRPCSSSSKKEKLYFRNPIKEHVCAHYAREWHWGPPRSAAPINVVSNTNAMTVKIREVGSALASLSLRHWSFADCIICLKSSQLLLRKCTNKQKSIGDILSQNSFLYILRKSHFTKCCNSSKIFFISFVVSLTCAAISLSNSCCLTFSHISLCMLHISLFRTTNYPFYYSYFMSYAICAPIFGPRSDERWMSDQELIHYIEINRSDFQ